MTRRVERKFGLSLVFDCVILKQYFGYEIPVWQNGSD
jgi:hypothetical protein